MSNLVEIDATGDAVAVGSVLHSVILTAGSDAASVEIRDDSGTAVKLTLKAAANTSVVWQSKGVLFGTSIHATLSGTSPLVYIEYS